MSRREAAEVVLALVTAVSGRDFKAAESIVGELDDLDSAKAVVRSAVALACTYSRHLDEVLRWEPGTAHRTLAHFFSATS